MDIQQLRYFSVLAATGNFTRASAELHLTQSALSKSISAMETELGTPLFCRTNKGARLNESGKEFVRFARAVLEEYDRCLLRLHEISDTQQRAVNLVCTLPEIFIRVLERFHLDYPDVHVRLPASDTMSAGEMLLTGQLDFVVNTMPLQHNLLEWLPIMRDEFFLMVPDNMPYAPGQEVDLWTFREEPFIMPQSSLENRIQMEAFCNQAGFTPHVNFEVTEAEATRKLVQLGYGISFVSSLSMRNTQEIPDELPQKLRTRFLRIRQPLCYRTIGICRVKNRPLSFSANRLYDCFLDFFQETQRQIAAQFPMPSTGEIAQ